MSIADEMREEHRRGVMGTGSGSLAMFTAIRRASSRMSLE
jgi:hypothetical protein